MKIGYDLQPLQTEQSAKRGIGRFTNNIVKALLEINKDAENIVFTNELYESPNLKLQNTSVKSIQYKNPKTKQDILTNNLLQLLKYQNETFDIFHIFSPFEGYPSNLPIISPYFDKLSSKLCTVIHDFIPLHLSEHYLRDSSAKRAYYRQLKTIYNSDILFAVSEATRIDAINMLNIHPDKVVTIGEGVSDSFFKIDKIPKNNLSKIKNKFKIKEKFVLYTGGIDYRKNIEKSIEAFSKIEQSHLTDTSYVIVCEIFDDDRKRLMSIAKDLGVENNVVLTGFISDEDLNLLYNSCSFFVFPSIVEGFGLPLLEAMTCGAPVIGSFGSSIFELIEDEEYAFNPENIDEISSLMSKMLSNDDFCQKSKIHSLKKASEYSWNNTASKITSAYQKFDKFSKQSSFIKKPRIAYFSPLPPKKSGIADYSASILPFLEKHLDVDIFIDDYECTDNYINENFNLISYHEFPNLHEQQPYDAVIYQMGNSENHVYMFDFVKKYPGIVVLHDVYLSGVLFWITGKVGKTDEFIEEVIYSHGEQGKKLVDKAKKNLISWDKLIWEFQLNKRFIENSTQILVHSNWDKQQILSQNPQFDKKISLIHQLSPIVIRSDNNQVKEKLGFTSDDFIICSFGFVVTTKKIHSVIENLKSFLENTKNAKYVIVGDTSDPYGQSLHKLVKELHLENRVIFTDYVDENTYQNYLQICDLCISLRINARAGTSASINHAIGAGIPTIISDDDSFRDYSDEILIKVKPDEEKTLGSIVKELKENDAKRMEYSKNSQNFAIKNFSIESCANKYINIVKEITGTE